MTRLRRNLLTTALAVLLIAALTASYAAVRWVQFKRDQGIVALRIDGLRVTTNGIGLRQFALTRQQADGARVVVEVNDLWLSLQSWLNPLPPTSLRIARASVAWRRAIDVAQQDDSLTLPSGQQLQRWAAWVPRVGRIDSVRVDLPCASGRCSEAGKLSWHHAGRPLLPAGMGIELERGSHRLSLELDARQRAAATDFNLQLLLDGTPRLSLQNRMTPDGERSTWLGSLSLSELPEAPWLLDWLGSWLADSPPELPALPDRMRLGAGWALDVAADPFAQDWQALSGQLRLSADLPAPWPVVGIGQLHGRLDLDARAERGAWIPVDLAADLTLLPVAARVSTLPAALRPSALRLEIAPDEAREPNTLPLKLQLAASGPAPLSLAGRILVDTTAPYGLMLENDRLQIQVPTLSTADWTVKGFAADVRVSGQLSRQNAIFHFGKGSTSSLKSLTGPGNFIAKGLLAQLADTHIEASFADAISAGINVKGKPGVTIAELRHPSLQPQGWRWSGTLVANPAQVSLEGALNNDAGLNLPVTLRHDQLRDTTHLAATLPELFLRAGNPLATTLADWPPLLELNNGRLQAEGQLVVPPTGPFAATASLTAKGVGGILDRTEFSGLSAALSMILQRDQLRLEVAELSVHELNPGFTFGPLQLSGHYTGPLDNLATGRLTWEMAEARLLGGKLWLKPGMVDLAADKQQLEARLRGLQLALLLEAYPAEGLSGTGIIDGALQVQRNPAGISIEQGSLQARAPGGALQFRSPKIQAMGQSNPAMRLVTEALDNFHYDLLASDVRYAANGKLDLGLKLQGRNPALEGGRPINFSVNLQEDIPALLTSLQLSDRVSEAIQRRVQQHLRKER